MLQNLSYAKFSYSATESLKYLLNCSTPKDPNFERYNEKSGFSFQLSATEI